MDKAEVQTTNEYKSLHNKSFSGKIVKRNKFNDAIVLVEEECGCSHWINVSWLKPVSDNCKN